MRKLKPFIKEKYGIFLINRGLNKINTILSKKGLRRIEIIDKSQFYWTHRQSTNL